MGSKDNHVKAGDKVMLQFGGWQTIEPVTVYETKNGDAYVFSQQSADIYITAESTVVLDHKPDVSRLQADVKAAQEALEKAQEALVNAGGTLSGGEITKGSQVRLLDFALNGKVIEHDIYDEEFPYRVEYTSHGSTTSNWFRSNEVEAV